jgi:hypothetical protein
MVWAAPKVAAGAAGRLQMLSIIGICAGAQTAGAQWWAVRWLCAGDVAPDMRRMRAVQF